MSFPSLKFWCKVQMGIFLFSVIAMVRIAQSICSIPTPYYQNHLQLYHSLLPLEQHWWLLLQKLETEMASPNSVLILQNVWVYIQVGTAASWNLIYITKSMYLLPYCLSSFIPSPGTHPTGLPLRYIITIVVLFAAILVTLLILFITLCILRVKKGLIQSQHCQVCRDARSLWQNYWITAPWTLSSYKNVAIYTLMIVRFVAVL